MRNKHPKRRGKAKLRDDRQTAVDPNEVWTMDFVHHQLATGKKLRILTVVDTHSRYCNCRACNRLCRSGHPCRGDKSGLTETDRVSEGLKAEAKQNNVSEVDARDAAVRRIPMGRLATPEEVVQVALFLRSIQAKYVTGVIIGMDGAQTATVV